MSSRCCRSVTRRSRRQMIRHDRCGSVADALDGRSTHPTPATMLGAKALRRCAMDHACPFLATRSRTGRRWRSVVLSGVTGGALAGEGFAVTTPGVGLDAVEEMGGRPGGRLRRRRPAQGARGREGRRACHGRLFAAGVPARRMNDAKNRVRPPVDDGCQRHRRRGQPRRGRARRHVRREPGHRDRRRADRRTCPGRWCPRRCWAKAAHRPR